MTDVLHGNDELTKLADAADTLARVVERDAERLADDAHLVVDRLRERRFEVAVVGEFNRGKSTLINLLLQRVVLPSGVLPVTSIVTELTHGDEQARVMFTDGSDEVIDLTQLEQYVTEESNPGNNRNVEGVHVSLPASVLQHGVTLIDTPGVGSIFRHNSDAARDVILHADGAVMVLSADTPMTDAERSLIKLLSRRSERTFFVLNRIDFLTEEELQRVQWFVGNVLMEAFGAEQQLYSLSARTGNGFETFAGAFEQFLSEGLDNARLSLARRDLASLADRIENETVIEESALALSAGELEDKIGEFQRSTAWQNESFADDRVLFRHASDRMLEELGQRVDALATPDAPSLARLQEAVANAPRNEIESVVDQTIEDEIKRLLEPLRSREEAEIERTWRRSAQRFEKATQRRVDRLREIAGELFAVDLRPIRLNQPAMQRGRFFYSSPVHVASSTSAFGRLFRPLWSEERSRRAALEDGTQRFESELRRHVDRVKEDLAQRVTDANDNFEQGMGAQVNQIAEAMMLAVERAQEAKSNAEREQEEQRQRARRLREAAMAARNAAIGDAEAS